MDDTMDTLSAQYLRHRLARFSQAIEAAREQVSDPSALGRYPASAPYYERSGIVQLFNSLDDESGEWRNLKGEFDKLEQDLRQLEADLGPAYRKLLHGELKTCLDSYFSAVCHANLGGTMQGSDQDLLCRDRIVILIRELEKDHDLSGARDLLGMLDANLFPHDAITDSDLIDPSLQNEYRLHPSTSRNGIEG
ncbi:MAG: hypothetical protein CVV32_07315 [Methanomicrobiales archaeon HGW-Methanomicrobiales-3]|jgi:hypothetical protein|nr:MAG: hypothetical protein CVV32_07315 [Methanomicrobiales archaeon HGW-Methanomicrobiales-3]